MHKVTYIVALFSVATIFAIGGTSAHAQNEQGSSNITVKKGDTLSKIAKKKKSTYIRIFNANEKIEHPDLIYPGDTLRIPGPNEKLENRSASIQRSTPRVSQAAPQNTRQPRPSQSQARSQQTQARTQTVTPAPRSASSNAGVWDRLANCESGGNWSINTGNGYYGGLQFNISSWRYVGGSGYPHQASKAEQIKRAEMLQAKQGWGAWPACTAKLNIR